MLTRPALPVLPPSHHAGTIKRHGFSRGPMTHGSKNHRIPGSIGMSATPARVLPGKKMAGKMGNVMAKERKLQVVKVDEELGCMLIRGSTPGKPGGMLRITPAKIVGKNV
jgi:large subunit ribosomal protein L3